MEKSNERAEIMEGMGLGEDYTEENPTDEVNTEVLTPDTPLASAGEPPDADADADATATATATADADATATATADAADGNKLEVAPKVESDGNLTTQILIDQIKELKQELRDSYIEEPEEKEEIFKELTSEELTDLMSEDPAAAMVYIQKAQKNSVSEIEKKLKSEITQIQQDQQATKVQTVFDEAMSDMEKVAPGIFKEGSDVQAQLSKHAESIGFSDDLFYLTNPSTQVILPGSDTPVYLGKQAAKILGVIMQSKASSKTKPKVKPKAGYKDISGLSSRGDSKSKDLTELQFAKLSPGGQQKYLQGL